MIVFPRENNPLWPLPYDYWELLEDGKRLARVNACSLRGKPELQVASWDFFRRTYLFPMPQNMFYSHGVGESPPEHAKWVYFWAANRLSALAAPRGFAKSTLLAERSLQDLLTLPFNKLVGFHSILTKVHQAIEKLMLQIEQNHLIIQDFGKMKPPRGSHYSWNKSCLQLKNGSKIQGFPIAGASLGERPNRIYFDDPEDPRDYKVNPVGVLEEFQSFLMGTVLPMATNQSVKIQFVNTNYSNRTFSYWMHNTEDPKITKNWARLLEAAEWIDDRTGKKVYMWANVITPEFLEMQKSAMGPAEYSANYLNRPTVDSERILQVHPQLCTYKLLDVDAEAYEKPFNSQARVRTHRLVEWLQEANGVQVPKYRAIERSWAEVVGNMKRFIMVDYATTTTELSDFSAIHVMGLENSETHLDTLWSLDAWVGKVRLEELTRHIYRLAVKWQVPIVGVEAFEIQGDYAERVRADLPLLYGSMELAPRVYPIKPNKKLSKVEKIKRLEWRFCQFRMKLPDDYMGRPDHLTRAAYTQLYDQIEKFTENENSLAHDDILDTLAMHQFLGKARTAPTAPDMDLKRNAWDLVCEGKDETSNGVPIVPGTLPIQHITMDHVRQLRMRAWENVDEEEPIYDFLDTLNL